MRVLLIKTSSMGDVLHTLPALTDAQRAIPGIVFDWVVEEAFAEICSWHPAVDRVLPVALRRWRRRPFRAWRSGEWADFKQSLRAARYDLVLDAQGLLKSAWLTRYVDAPVAGLDRSSAREPLAARWYDRPQHVSWSQHAVERVRQLFAQALGYEVPTCVGDYGIDRARLAPAEVAQPFPYILLLHGTTWDTKHWPELYWRQLAEHLTAAGWQVRLPWGNEEERARAERIACQLDAALVLPRMSLTDMAREIAGASACIAVDTGLGHLAAALDVPTISLFGPTHPAYTGAYGRAQRHLASDFPCAPCLKKHCTYRPTDEDRRRFDLDREQPLCFTRLPPARVADELKQMLGEEEVLVLHE